MIDSVSLTINRFCNFRCLWCYAKAMSYSKDDDMSFDLAKTLVDFSKTLGAKSILLTGGEPTYYPYLSELIKYIKKEGLESILLTNGYKFKNIGFLKKVEKAGLNKIVFSIKAANAKQQKKLTTVNAFDDIKQAIRNLATVKNIKVGYCTVISNDTIDNIEEFAKMIAEIDTTKCLMYSTCNPVFDKNGSINKKYVTEPRYLIDVFMKKFGKIREILNDKVLIEQSLASCLWPKEFIKNLNEKKQLVFNCHLKKRNGLIFDKDGKIVMCNTLLPFPIGQYNVDFTTKEEFEKFWMSEKIISLYRKICEYPSTKCQICDDYLDCGGGCPLKWFAYNAEEMEFNLN